MNFVFFFFDTSLRRQTFMVKNLIVKSAVSPRPGVWVLEKSLDGLQFTPWQYFAPSDLECRNRFGVSLRAGARPPVYTDDEAVCTAHYSRLEPLEGGEVRPLSFNQA
jgi:laminin alpha 1/2